MAKRPTRIGCFRAGSRIEEAMTGIRTAMRDVERGLQFSHVHEISYRDGARLSIDHAVRDVRQARGHLNGLVRSHLSRAMTFLKTAKKDIPRKRKRVAWGRAGEILVDALGALNDAKKAAEMKCLRGW